MRHIFKHKYEMNTGDRGDNVKLQNLSYHPASEQHGTVKSTRSLDMVCNSFSFLFFSFFLLYIFFSRN